MWKLNSFSLNQIVNSLTMDRIYEFKLFQQEILIGLLINVVDLKTIDYTLFRLELKPLACDSRTNAELDYSILYV